MNEEKLKIFKKNVGFTIVDKYNNSVDIKTFTSKTRKSYYYSTNSSLFNCYETIEEAQKVVSKSKRDCTIKKVEFNNIDVSKCYNGEGANIIGFDFMSSKIWIESKDKSKYGYDYRYIEVLDIQATI
jgi:hypothetical protein